MKRIVITGSSRGIGYGLGTYFLEHGNKVCIVGSTGNSTNKAYESLKNQYQGQVYKIACDVTKYEQVVNLSQQAQELMGGIDIWINNAGITQPSMPTHLVSEEDIRRIVDINIHGVINGSKVALDYFYKQKSGSLYNMEGLGSDGRLQAGMAYYGGTKRFLRYYTRSLAKENSESGVLIGRLSPGMVTTDLLLKGLEHSADKENTMKIFSILADKVEDVTPYLGQRILSNTKNNVLIAWLTTPKIIYRFLSAPFVKRHPFD